MSVEMYAVFLSLFSIFIRQLAGRYIVKPPFSYKYAQEIQISNLCAIDSLVQKDRVAAGWKERDVQELEKILKIHCTFRFILRIDFPVLSVELLPLPPTSTLSPFNSSNCSSSNTNHIRFFWPSLLVWLTTSCFFLLVDSTYQKCRRLYTVKSVPLHFSSALWIYVVLVLYYIFNHSLHSFKALRA